jgi:hypothetical protein
MVVHSVETTQLPRSNNIFNRALLAGLGTIGAIVFSGIAFVIILALLIITGAQVYDVGNETAWKGWAPIFLMVPYLLLPYLLFVYAIAKSNVVGDRVGDCIREVSHFHGRLSNVYTMASFSS